MTFKTLQSMFAREIGELDYTALTQTHKDILNDAIQIISSRHPFSYNRKTASSTFVDDSASAPSDMDYSQINENKLYSYSGTDKSGYTLVSKDEVSRYGTDKYIYAVDFENSKLLTNQSGASYNFEYQSIPKTLSALTDVVNPPIPEVIVAAAANIYWNGVEGEEARAEKTLAKSEELIKRAIYEDIKTKPATSIPHPFHDYDLGY